MYWRTVTALTAVVPSGACRPVRFSWLFHSRFTTSRQTASLREHVVHRIRRSRPQTSSTRITQHRVVFFFFLFFFNIVFLRLYLTVCGFLRRRVHQLLTAVRRTYDTSVINIKLSRRGSRSPRAIYIIILFVYIFVVRNTRRSDSFSFPPS